MTVKHCKHKGEHKVLPEKDADAMCQHTHAEFVKIMRTVQEALYSQGVCEANFLNIMIGVTCRIAGETIKHLVESTSFTRQNCIDVVMGGIAEEVGATFISLSKQQANDQCVSKTTH